jgi:hypothetical protein
VSFSTEGWTFVPLIDTQQVVRLFVFRDDNTPAPGEISGLLYQRDAAGAWIADAWENAFHEDMFAAVIVIADLDPEQAFTYFPKDVDAALIDAAIAEAVTPEPFSMGLFENDPLHPLMLALADPEPVLNALEGSGYPALATIGGASVSGPTPGTPGGPSVPVPGLNPCLLSTTALLDAIEGAFEEYEASGADFLTTFRARCGGGCTARIRSVVTNAAGPASCSPWRATRGPYGNSDNCTAQCNYERTVTSVQTRKVTIICSDCTRIDCTDTRTRTTEQSVIRTSFSMQPLCKSSAVTCDLSNPPNIVCNHASFLVLFPGYGWGSWSTNCTVAYQCP